MKKLPFLYLILTILFTSSVSIISAKSKLPKEAKTTIKTFQKSVKAHDQSGIMSTLESNYVKEQHDGFLEGRTEQFINELLCGTDLQSDKFQCAKLDDILSIKLATYDIMDDKIYVRYTVTTSDKKIDIELYLFPTKYENTDKTTYKFIGAIG